MPAEPFTHFVFVDLENVPDPDLVGLGDQPVHVTLLIGRQQRRLPLGLVRQIHRLAAQVELVEVGASGHNALDLILAFYLGQAAQRSPRATFAIVSKDRDFEPMIQHARAERLEVARYDSFAALPFLGAKETTPPRPSPAQAADRRSRVIARLTNPAAPNRPATRQTLLAHLKTALGKGTTDAEAEQVVRELIERQQLRVGPRDKIIYRGAAASAKASA